MNFFHLLKMVDRAEYLPSAHQIHSPSIVRLSVHRSLPTWTTSTFPLTLGFWLASDNGKDRENQREEKEWSQTILTALPCKVILDDCNSPQKLLSWIPFHTAPCICRSWWPSPSEAYKCLLWLVPRTAPSLNKFPVSYPNRTAICSARALTAALGKCNKWARQPWVLFWCL